MTKIVLGVTGGIAAYKSADLVRRLKECQFDVRVVMSEAAKSFITPVTMQAVSGNPVHHQLFDCQSEAAMGHIELAKWADIILVAPATANSIAKMAVGLADDLLLTLILASKAQLMVAPAMNQQMWSHATTQNNIKLLRERQVVILDPASGEQACGDIGPGRMLEPLQIVELVVKHQSQHGNLSNSQMLEHPLRGKNIVITAGPTVEAIDPVRYISNYSSGKMGYALAHAAIIVGANVTLVSGPVSISTPENVTVKPVTSAKQMLTEVKQQLANCDVFIGCAAVADYSPSEVATQKIKKSSEEIQIVLTKTVDIVAWVAAQKDPPFMVGFAAETQNLEAFAKKKLEKKKLDMICANDISGQEVGFNSDKNEVLILNKNGKELKLAAASKANVAKDIINEIGKHFS